ncbi:hypothetical protein ACFU6K_37930 [Kitasatospora sp. NPDC057512]|uniref:hypothetical protein n=1 Tax=Kitasatospora sp. NPDC057512 TaxID=3346154 RepID=UPI0036979340
MVSQIKPTSAAVAGLLAVTAAVLAGVRTVWYWTSRPDTLAAVDRADRVVDAARSTVVQTQDLLNWGWLAAAVLLLALGAVVALASTGRWLLFGFSALVCMPLGVAGFRLPAAAGLNGTAAGFCVLVVAASAVALLTGRRD